MTAFPKIGVILAFITTKLSFTTGIGRCVERCSPGFLSQVHRTRPDGTCQEQCVAIDYLSYSYECGPCPSETTTITTTTKLVKPTQSQRDLTKVGYQTTLLLDDMPPKYHLAFTNAARRWEQVIIGDVPDITTSAQIKKLSACAPNVPNVIDDILVCPSLPCIDGPGGVLGSATFEYTRASGLPITGVMQFDYDDVQRLFQKGKLNRVVLHEIGHLYGFSTEAFKSKGLESPVTCRYKKVSAASREWQKLTGCKNSIPVELGGGCGTACSHWSEKCLKGEMMTGYLSGGMLLSRMTVGALDDLGYTVDYGGADAFGKGQINPACISYCLNYRGKRRLGGDDDDDKDDFYNISDTLSTSNSTVARDLAIAHGKAILKKNAVIAARHLEEADDEEGEASYTYVGHQSVHVVYEDDDGNIESIEVSSS